MRRAAVLNVGRDFDPDEIFDERKTGKSAFSIDTDTQQSQLNPFDHVDGGNSAAEGVNEEDAYADGAGAVAREYH